MIRHIVMLNLPAGYDVDALAGIMDGLADLDLTGFDRFEHGPNRDLENRTPDYPYGFICTFADLAALQRYAADPAHQALGSRLVTLCGGGERIMVMDLDV